MADIDFYRDVFGGKGAVDEADLKRAENIISAAFGSRNIISEKYFDMAVCAQAEYMVSSRGTEGVKKLSLGDYSAEYSDSTVSRSDLICREALCYADMAFSGNGDIEVNF